MQTLLRPYQHSSKRPDPPQPLPLLGRALSNQEGNRACVLGDVAPGKPVTPHFACHRHLLGSDHPPGTFHAAGFSSGFPQPGQVRFFHLGGVAAGVY